MEPSIWQTLKASIAAFAQFWVGIMLVMFGIVWFVTGLVSVYDYVLFPGVFGILLGPFLLAVGAWQVVRGLVRYASLVITPTGGSIDPLD